MKCVYMALMPLDLTGKGRKRRAYALEGAPERLPDHLRRPAQPRAPTESTSRDQPLQDRPDGFDELGQRAGRVAAEQPADHVDGGVEQRVAGGGQRVEEVPHDVSLHGGELVPARPSPGLITPGALSLVWGALYRFSAALFGVHRGGPLSAAPQFAPSANGPRANTVVTGKLKPTKDSGA